MRSPASQAPQALCRAGRIEDDGGLFPTGPAGPLSVPLLTALLGLGLVLGAAGFGRGEESPPNVLLILTDDQGWGDVRCCGAADLDTPNLDRLAAGGMRMTNFYANCPVCSPTRAALLTGRYPESVGVPGVIRTHPRNSWGSLAPNARLLPAILAEHGYATALIGKWHLGLAPGDHPNARGFEFFHGFLGDMMDDYWTHRRHGLNYMRQNERVIDPVGHASDLFSDWACDYLRSWAAGEPASSRKPFFLYLAYNAPHVPIQPPAEALAAYRQRHPDASAERAALAALIEHLDAGIGRVLSTLRELGLEEQTLVLFSSDNGGQLNVGANNGPYRDGKGTVYEGGIRVPMIARWPGKVPAASQSDA
ncbi:MAG: sulfatase-like hydrolase/transferase, partial [Thermogutta sp.]|nr:sulfatase-like hydrolase/transferase [Thermogutta sp.]